MKEISITGFSGFIGKHILKSGFFKNYFSQNWLRNNINVNQNSFCVIHLAGIAHDLSNKYEQKDYNEINFKLTKKFLKNFKIK